MVQRQPSIEFLTKQISHKILRAKRMNVIVSLVKDTTFGVSFHWYCLFHTALLRLDSRSADGSFRGLGHMLVIQIYAYSSKLWTIFERILVSVRYILEIATRGGNESGRSSCSSCEVIERGRILVVPFIRGWETHFPFHVQYLTPHCSTLLSNNPRLYESYGYIILHNNPLTIS